MRNKFIASVISVAVCSAIAICGIHADENTNQVYVSNTQELMDALSNATAGDEIILKEGVYENDEWVGKWAVFYSSGEGTAEKPIILRSENPENPATLQGITDENKMGLYITGDYWIIKDIKVSTAQKGIILDNSNYSIISNCEVYNTGSEGIHLRDNSSYCLIENCYVHDNGTVTPKYGEAIYIGSAKGTEGYGFDCHYNTVRGCKLGANTGAEHIDIKEYTIGTLVENCTFDGTGMSGENYADSFVDIKGNDVIVRNNVGYRNNNSLLNDAFQLCVFDGWGQNALIYGNTVYMDDAEGYVVNGYDCSVKASNNTRIPEGNQLRGNLVSEVIAGDVNEDNSLNETDVNILKDYLLSKENTDISLIGADLIPDGIIDIADLVEVLNRVD